jgi:hypothetical protein
MLTQQGKQKINKLLCKVGIALCHYREAVQFFTGFYDDYARSQYDLMGRLYPLFIKSIFECLFCAKSYDIAGCKYRAKSFVFSKQTGYDILPIA